MRLNKISRNPNRLSRLQRDMLEDLMLDKDILVTPPLRTVLTKPHTWKTVTELAMKGLVNVVPLDERAKQPPEGGFFPDVWEQKVVLTERGLKFMLGSLGGQSMTMAM